MATKQVKPAPHGGQVGKGRMTYVGIAAIAVFAAALAAIAVRGGGQSTSGQGAPERPEAAVPGAAANP